MDTNFKVAISKSHSMHNFMSFSKTKNQIIYANIQQQWLQLMVQEKYDADFNCFLYLFNFNLQFMKSIFLIQCNHLSTIFVYYSESLCKQASFYYLKVRFYFPNLNNCLLQPLFPSCKLLAVINLLNVCFVCENQISLKLGQCSSYQKNQKD